MRKIEVKSSLEDELCGFWQGVKKTPEEMMIMSKAVGETYRCCKTRMKYYERMAIVSENQKEYQDDLALVTIVDLTLENCSRVSQLIIRKEFLEINDKNWYMEFFSRTTFYRNKKKAVKEFIENLTIPK